MQVRLLSSQRMHSLPPSATHAHPSSRTVLNCRVPQMPRPRPRGSRVAEFSAPFTALEQADEQPESANSSLTSIDELQLLVTAAWGGMRAGGSGSSCQPLVATGLQGALQPQQRTQVASRQAGPTADGNSFG